MQTTSSTHSFKPAGRFPRNGSSTAVAAKPRRQLRQADIAAVTGPFCAFHERARVLVVADVENIAYGGRDLGMTVDFGKLADRLRAALIDPALHAVVSAPANDNRIAEFLSDSGWTPHQREIVGRHTNADAAIAFQTAVLIARTGSDACVIASGDGGLALDIAQGTRAAFGHCNLIATLSLAGSTSRLIDARNTRHIDVNIEIGRDVMRDLVRECEELPSPPVSPALAS
jgi:hypothetical protein